MKELNQGEDYEENDYGFEDEDEFDESGEDTSAGIDTIYGIPKNFFIIGVIGIVLIAIVIILFATRGSGESEDDIVYPEVNTSTAVDYVEDQTYTEESYTEEPTYAEDTYTEETVTSENLPFYDESGNTAGYYFTADNETFYVYDEAGNNIGDSQAGVDLNAYDTSGNILFLYSLYASDSSTESAINTDNDELRKLGYTGDEIELAQANGVDHQVLIDHAKELRDAEAKEALIRMSDSASEEFQMIVNNSIFCMNEIKFPVESYEELTISEEHEYIVNADYWKVPTYGLQLYIKCKIANGTYVFYSVRPSRWVTLPEEGNIVLNIKYRLYGNDDTFNCYVESITEVDTTELTVNPQDSGVNLNDVVNKALSEE